MMSSAQHKLCAAARLWSPLTHIYIYTFMWVRQLDLHACKASAVNWAGDVDLITETHSDIISYLHGNLHDN